MKRYWKRPVRRYFLLALIAFFIALQTPAVWGQTSAPIFYVNAATGNDNNPGTSGAPWRTIQKCAETAPSGSICQIARGIYRETVVARRDNVTFRGAGADTIVAGTDEIAPAAWRANTDGTYSTTINWSMNLRTGGGVMLYNNQVFWGDQMLPEARWPNLSDYRNVTQLTDSTAIREDDARATAATGQGNRGSYTAPGLSQIPDFRGGKISYIPGYRIMGSTCDVESKTGSVVNFVCNTDPAAGWNNILTRNSGDLNPGMLSPNAGNYFYLWGRREFLDSPGEWFIDPNKNNSGASQFTLTIMPPRGMDPRVSPERVQVKRRPFAFDLWSRSGIRIENLAIFGAKVKFESTNNSTVDQVIWQYPHHFQEAPPYFFTGGTSAIHLKGSNNRITNSYLAHAPGSMIQLEGSNHLVENNVIQNVGYAGVGSGVAGSAPGTKVRRNTMFNSGRYWIQMERGVDVTYNDIYRSHLQITDLGPIYGWGADGNGAQIAYNFIHDCNSEKNSPQYYFGCHGIYPDDNVTGFDIHHNVLWNLNSPGLQIATYNPNHPDAQRYNPGKNSLNMRVFNNTSDDLGYLIRDGFLTGLQVRNNIFRKQSAPPSSNGRSVDYSDNFFGEPNPGLDKQFVPQEGSPVINKGRNLPPFTDGFFGSAPDIGAMEYGKPPFVAGALLRDADIAQIQVSCAQAGSNLNCTVSNLPMGRKVPSDMQIKVGNQVITGFRNQTNYANNTSTAIASLAVSGSESNPSQVEVSLGGNTWVSKANQGGSAPSPSPSPSPSPVPSPLPSPSPVPSPSPSPVVTPASFRIDRVNPRVIGAGAQAIIEGAGFQNGAINPYSRAITVSNGDSQALNDYQVMVNVNTQELIAAGKMQANARDLRFLVNGQEIPFWIESGLNTPETRIWLRVPTIPANGNTTVTMSYGNASLTSRSNARSVFLLFDDFSDGQIADWIFVNPPPASVKIEERGGSMVVEGTPEPNDPFAGFGFALKQSAPEIANLPAAIAVDTWVNVNRGTSRGKLSAGGFDQTISVYDTPQGTPPQKKLGFWDGSSWQNIGSSNWGTATVRGKIFTFGLVRRGSTADVYWQEDRDPEILTQRTGLNNPRWGFFSYSPWEARPFQVGFARLAIRRFNPIEPTASVANVETNNAQLQVFFDNTAATRITFDSPNRIRAVSAGANPASVRVVNPSGESASFNLR
jgi:hypothetical protein